MIVKVPDVQESQITTGGVSQDSRHGDSTAISMSKDSLDEGKLFVGIPVVP